MIRQYPTAVRAVFHAVKVAMVVVKKDIRAYGREEAYRLFMDRSEGWILSHDHYGTTDPDEAVAIAAFAAALSFINVLWHTGEIDSREQNN